MTLKKARQIAQQRERGAVRPVQVVEHEHERRPTGKGPEHLGDRVEEAKALLLGGQCGGLRETGEPLWQLGDDLGEDCAEAPEVLLQRLGIPRLRVTRKRF